MRGQDACIVTLSIDYRQDRLKIIFFSKIGSTVSGYIVVSVFHTNGAS